MQSKAYRGVALQGGVARWYDVRAQKVRGEKQGLARRVAELVSSAANVLEVPARGISRLNLQDLATTG